MREWRPAKVNEPDASPARHVWRLPVVALCLLLTVSGCQSDETKLETGSDGGVDRPVDSAGIDTTGRDVVETSDGRDLDGQELAVPDGDDTTGDVPDGVDVTERDSSSNDAGCTAPTDSDADGLTDCQERELCTDPNDGDTDGDHLGDFEEYQRYQTDPCSQDSDADGVPDGREVELGLDPNRPVSYNDGKRDATRWVVDACDRQGPEPIQTHTSGPGNWTVALGTGFSKYTNLTIPAATRPVAASVFGHPSSEVAGALLSTAPSAGSNSVSDTLNSHVRPSIRPLGTVIHNFAEPAFQTHDGKPAVRIEYELETSRPTSVRRMRDDVLFALAPFQRGEVQGRPSTAGAKFDSFRVEIAVVGRSTSTGPSSTLFALAVAPLQAFDAQRKVQSHVDDLTNTTNIADKIDTTTTGCTRRQPPKKRPAVDFYFVLDDSTSGNSEATKLEGLAPQLVDHLNRTTLDFRLGVTNLDYRNEGRLGVPPGWHSNLATFRREIRDRVMICKLSPRWWCDGGSRESPLHNAMLGLRYMKGLTAQQPSSVERIRSDAAVYTLTLVDEPPQGPKRQMATAVIPRHTRAFYLVPLTKTIEPGTPTRTTCGPTKTNDLLPFYEPVARASGGTVVDVCKTNLGQTVESIFDQAAGRLSHYRLGETPISSSILVFLNGRWVPRSRKNGFDYFPGRNALAFFGDYRPDILRHNGRPRDVVAVHYETFVERCKTKGNANTCR